MVTFVGVALKVPETRSARPRRASLGACFLLIAALPLWVHGCHAGGHEEDDLALAPRLISDEKQPAGSRPMKPTAAEIMKLLDLKPHPTCGFTSETFVSSIEVPASALPAYDGPRPAGGILYFMVTPEAQIKLHRIRSDQMYHHYLGDPLEVLLLYPDGTSAVKMVGADIKGGQRPQLLVPGGTFHISRLPAGAAYSLLATSVWIKPASSDVEQGKPEELKKRYPKAAADIDAFVKGR